MDVFDELAKYYDLIHENKNYEKESAYINGLIQKYNPGAKTILDIGCGTGNYAFAMQKLGYEVEGVDSSSQMIDIAKGKLSENDCNRHRPSFFCGQIEEYDSQTKFDAVICLFFSLCYQTTDDLIFDSLTRFKNQIKENGILIFDFWHKDGVLTQKPELKIQNYCTADLEITKLVQPRLDVSADCVNIDYTFYLENRKTEISKFKEFHKLRYLNPNLIVKLLRKLSFKVIQVEGWMTNKKLQENEWSGIILARPE